MHLAYNPMHCTCNRMHRASKCNRVHRACNRMHQACNRMHQACNRMHQAYNRTHRACHPRVQAHPEAKAKELMSLLGAAWKALSAEEKKTWEGAAVADKARYAAEVEAVGGAPAATGAPKAGGAMADKPNKAKEEEIKREIEAAKAEVEEHDAASTAMKQPKAHRTSLACYKKKQIPVIAGSHPDLPVEQIQELMQENFEKLSASVKRPYEEEAEADLLRYQTACEEHKAKKDAVQKLKADTKRKLERLEKDLKDERARMKEARAAAVAANKVAKEEKAATKQEKEVEKAAKAEKVAVKKATKEAKGDKKVAEGVAEVAADDMEVEEATSGDATAAKAAIEEAVADEADEEK